MELLLTPLLNRFLRKFIKSSSEGSGSELRASLSSRGTLTLHNLELCLDSVLEGVGFLSVSRAFARRLELMVPWTGLTTQPVQVVLDTVELVLGPGDFAPAARQASVPPGQAAQQEPDASTSSWLGGTLQSFAVRAGLNISVKLNNVVVKYVEPSAYVASLTFSSLLLCTSADGWRNSLRNPEAWLKKECTIRGLTVCLDQARAGGGRRGCSFQPVLRAPCLRVTAQLPAFAFLEGAALLGDPFRTSVMVELDPLDVAVNNWQLQWAAMLAALLQEAAAAKAAARAVAAAEAAAAAAGPAAPPEQTSAEVSGAGASSQGGITPLEALPGSPPPPPLGEGGEEPGRGTLLSPSYRKGQPSRPATKALGVFGRVWDYVVDEAAYLESVEESVAPGAAIQREGSGASQEAAAEEGSALAAAALPPMHAELDVTLKGLSLHLAVVESLLGPDSGDLLSDLASPQPSFDSLPPLEGAASMGLGTASPRALLPPPPAAAAAQQHAAPHHHHMTPAEQEQRFLEALQAQLRGEGAAAPSPAPAAKPSKPAAAVHQLAALMVHHASVVVSSVDTSFTAVEVRLQGCSLLRNTAAAGLDPVLLCPPADAPAPWHCREASPSLPLEPSLSRGSLTPQLQPELGTSGSQQLGDGLLASPRPSGPLAPPKRAQSRCISVSVPGWDSLSAGLGAGTPAAVQYHKPSWDEVLGLHPLKAAPSSHSAASAAAAGAGPAATHAVHVRWQNPGPAAAAAAVAATGSAAAAAAAAAVAAAATADAAGQRCAVHVGQVFACWAPGLATSIALMVQPVLAAAGSDAVQGPLQEDVGQAAAAAAGSSASLAKAASRGEVAGSSGSSDGGSSSPLEAVLSGMLLEAHVGALQLALLSSQGPEAAGAVLSLLEIECRSGPLNWHSSWNRHLRESLLAPGTGFEGCGLRASAAALSLAVAQQWQPSPSRAGQLELPGTAPVSNAPQLLAVLTAARAGGAPAAQAKALDAGASTGTSSPQTEPAAAAPLLVSAALSPLSLAATGLQLAIVSAAVSGLTSELGQGFRGPLPPLPGEAAMAAGSGGAPGWIGSVALELGSLQLVYSQAHGCSELGLAGSSGGAAPLPAGLPSSARLLLCCPRAAATLAASSASAAAAAASGQQPARCSQAAVAVARLILAQPAVWASPGFGVLLPSAELWLGQEDPAAAVAAAAVAEQRYSSGSPALHAAGWSYASLPAEASTAAAAVGATSATPAPAAPSPPLDSKELRLASSSLALGPSHFAALVSLLGCIAACSALPALPAAALPGISNGEAEAAAGDEEAQAAAAEPKQQQQQQPAEAKAEAEGCSESKFSIRLDQLCLSVSTWEPAQQAQQQQQRAQHGLEGWASGLQYVRTSAPDDPSAFQLTLGTLGLELTRLEPGWRLPATSPAMSWPSAATSSSKGGAPALELSITPTPRPAAFIPQRRQLSLRAAPLSLTLAPELLRAAAAVANPIRVALRGPPGPEERATAGSQAQQEPEQAAAPEAPLFGSISLQGISLHALLAAEWEAQQGHATAPRGAKHLVLPPDSLPAAGAAPGAPCEAAELAFAEVALMLRQSPAEEGRPWLAGGEGGLTTTLDASLVGAELVVHHPGRAGTTSTAVLPAADGRLQLLRQQRTGCLALGLHAPALPLSISMPAIGTLSSLVSALSSAADELSLPAAGGERAQQPSSAGAAEAALPAAAPASHVYIEDAVLLEERRLSHSEASTSGPASPRQPWAGRPGATAVEALGPRAGSPQQPPGLGGDGREDQSGGSEVQLDDLRWGMFTSVAEEPGPRQVKATSAAPQRGGLSWPLSPQRAQRTEHSIQWAYPQDRPVTLLYVEGCAPALLSAEFTLGCYNEAAGGYIDIPIRAVALNSPPAAAAAGPGGAAAGAGAGQAHHDVALLALAAVPARQWQLRWEVLPSAAGGGAVDPTSAASVLRRLHINPPCWGHPGFTPGHAQICAELGLPHHPVPPPLAAPFTFYLEAEEAEVALLAPAAVGSAAAAAGGAGQPGPASQQAQQVQHTWDALVRLGLGRLRLAVHSWDDPSALAVDAQALASLAYLDSTTLTSTSLIEPFLLEACFESLSTEATAAAGGGVTGGQPRAAAAAAPPPSRAWLRSGGGSGSSSGDEEEDEEEEAAAGGLEGSPRKARARAAREAAAELFLPPPFFQQGLLAHDLGCLAVRPPPQRSGKSIGLQANQQPLVVNLSELTLPELQRLAAMLSAASSSSSEGGAGAAALAPPILLQNRCGVDLWVGQLDTEEALWLPSGAELPYRWAAPPALAGGAVRRLRLAAGAAGGVPAVPAAPPVGWSAPVEVMAQGASQVQLPLGPGVLGTLAVQVRREGLGWRVQLLPALRVTNHLGQPAYCCLATPSPPPVGTLARSSSSQGAEAATSPRHPLLGQRQLSLQRQLSAAVAAPPPRVQPLTLLAGGSATAALAQLLPQLGGGGEPGGPGVRLWMGEGQGWSAEVLLSQLAAGVQVLSAAPAGLEALSSPQGAPPPPAHLPALGAVLCHYRPLEAETGQAVLSLWPPVVLRNRLPRPLTLCLPQPGSAGGGGLEAAAAAAAAASGAGSHAGYLRCVEAGNTLPLPVPYTGGELVRLSLASPRQQQPAQQRRWSAPVCTPPMIGAGGGEGPPAAPDDAVLIAQPGDFTVLELPSSGPAATVVAQGMAGGHVGAAVNAPAAAAAGGQAQDSATRPATSSLECVLLTEQRSEELPVLTLTLLAPGLVRNCLPVPLVFQVPGCEPVSVPAHGSAPVDWRPLPVRPREATVSVEASLAAPQAQQAAGTGGGGGGSGGQQQQQQQVLLLTSQRFPIDASLDSHLVLKARQSRKAGVAGRSLRLLLEGRQAQGANTLECRLAAQVTVTKHPGDFDTVAITITPGCFVSNLSGLPLLLHPEGAAMAAGLACTGARGGNLPLADGATLPLLNLWGSPGTSGGSEHGSLSALASPRDPVAGSTAGSSGSEGASAQAGTLGPHRRMRSWGGSDLLRTLSSTSSLQQGPGAGPEIPSKPALRFAILEGGPAHAAAQSAACDELPSPALPSPQGWPAPAASQPGLQAPADKEHGWSSRVDPFEAVGRQRLYLQDPASGGAVLVTYRTLLNDGRLHLVLFRDRQPPFTIHNDTGAPLELGYCPPEELPGGGFEYRQPRYALRVAAGQLVECDFNPAKGKAGAGLAPEAEAELLSPRRGSGGKAGEKGGGGWEDEEDEDAFLDCLLQEELRVRGQAQERPPPVVKFRQPGTKEWLHPCALMPGRHPTGFGAQVEVRRSCATTHIAIRPAARAAGSAGEQGVIIPASPTAVAAAAELPAPAPEPVQPLRLTVQCRQLQLCLWDDDRRRLLPPPLPAVPVPPPPAAALAAPSHPAHPHSVPGHVVAWLPAAAKELFCLTVDGMVVGLAKCPQQPAGAGGGGGSSGALATGSTTPRSQSPTGPHVPPATAAPPVEARLVSVHGQQQYTYQPEEQLGRPLSSSAAGEAPPLGPAAAPPAPPSAGQQPPLVEFGCQLLARGLHCDSFLPGSEYPVVLVSQVAERAWQGAGAAGEGLWEEFPVCLQATVHHAPGPAHTAMSFRNAWIHRLVIRLPTLAVALDDALMAFVDHARGALGEGEPPPPQQPQPQPQQQQPGSAAAAGAPGSWTSDDACRPGHAEGLLAAELAAEAKGAAASRLYIETAAVEPIQVLADVHLSTGTAGLPVAVDVHRAPITLSRIAAHGALFRPHVLVRGLMAHGIAEALLNAPGMLGSLELLFNPTGLVQSVRQGVSDLVGLPMAALQARSPTQFLANVGRGSASLVRHLSGWTLSSISGFSTAFGRAVDSAVAIRQQRRAPQLPANVGRGLVQGLTGLAEGVAAGFAAVVEAPIQGYSSGSGVLSGLGRGLLGAIGLPVSGALELVGAVSAGLASSAGIAHRPLPRRSGRDAAAAAGDVVPLLGPAERGAAAAEGAEAAGGAQHAALLPAPHPQVGSLAASRILAQVTAARAAACSQQQQQQQVGQYVAHCAAEAAALAFGGCAGEGSAPAPPAAGAGEESQLVRAPVLLLCESGLVVCGEGGLAPVALLPLAGLQLQERPSTQEAVLQCPGGVALLPAASSGRGSQGGEGATVQIKLGRLAWLGFMPQLRRRLGAQARR